MSKRSNSSPANTGIVGKIAVGILLPIMGGFFLGNYLDERLGSAPWLMLLLLLLGIASGFGWLYKSVK